MELERHETEARRRFASIRAELEKNKTSIIEVCAGLEGRAVIPQLLTGSWRANAPSLGLIIADYDLIADLATFYGRIDELQWRLRTRLESEAVRPLLDDMTAPLASELKDEVAGLLRRVDAQVQAPSVQARGLLHQATITDTITISG